LAALRKRRRDHGGRKGRGRSVQKRKVERKGKKKSQKGGYFMRGGGRKRGPEKKIGGPAD